MNQLSVIIPVHPAHNQEGILGTCLKSLEKQTFPKDRTELVLIGDGCVLNYNLTVAGVKTVVYNSRERLGVSRARNEAMRLSNGELLAFIDADAVARDNWLENLTAGLHGEGVAGCAGAVWDVKNRCVNEDIIYGAGYPLPFAGLGNVVFKKEALMNAGGLDERFSCGGEDVDISWRLYLKGYRIEYAPDAVVIHKNMPNAVDFFCYGMRTRRLANKYKKVLELSNPLELRRYPTFIREGVKKRTLFPNLITLCGYLYALAEETIWPPSSTPAKKNLGDMPLQPPSSIKPLAVTFDSRALVKPNHIIWWKTKKGLRLLDLQDKRQYELEDISSRIWEYAMDGKSEDFITEQLAQEYASSPDTIRNDLKGFVGHLLSEKILSLP